MNHLRLKHWLVLGIAAAVLLAGGIAVVLLVGKDPPDTPPSETVGTEIETEGISPTNPYNPTVTIADDTLSPGQMWNITFTFGDEERRQHFEMHGVAFLQYTGEPDVIYAVNIKNSMVSSQLPSLYVPYDAPKGAYDLFVGMENMTTEGCLELGCDSFETIRIENFLTVLPPAYEDFTVTASLSPNVLEPGAALDGILSIDVRRNAPTISLYPSPDRHSLNYRAEMRQVDGNYSFEVWDTNETYVFDGSKPPQLRRCVIPADAPEGFYDLVVTMEEYGYEWVIPKLLLVWPEGKSLYDNLPAYEDFACRAEITDDSVTCLRGDAPEITVDLTYRGEVYTDFEAYLEFDRPSLSYPYTIPLTFDGAGGRAVFQVQFETPLESYALVVKDTQWGHTWRFPSFVTVEHWAFYTQTEQGHLLLTLALRNGSLGRGDEIESFFFLDSPEGRLTGFSVCLEYTGFSSEYSIPLRDPLNPSADAFPRIPENAPAGFYDLVVKYDPALAPSEPVFGKCSWRFPSFLMVLDERDTLG